jgi:hypothetical protein
MHNTEMGEGGKVIPCAVFLGLTRGEGLNADT